jgi:hypothetical protein
MHHKKGDADCLVSQVIQCSYDGASAAASVVSHSPSCSAIGRVSGRTGEGKELALLL